MKKTFIFFISIIVVFLTIAVLSNSNFDLSKISASVTSAINTNTYGKIHFINVSNGANVDGDAIVLESKGHLCLIDTGNPTQLVSKYDGKTYNYPNSDGVKVVDYIKNKIGGTKLDCILITHNHTDHNGGFKAVADSGLITSSTKFYYREFDNNNDKYKADNQAYYNIAKTAATNKGATLVNVNNATNVTFSVGNFNVKLLNTESWANRGHTGVTSEENNNSIVEYITINGRSILLTGDLEYVDETRLVNNNIIGKVNILKLGHHGRYTSSGFNFIDATNPDLVVVSGNADYYPKERNIPAIKYLKDKYGKDVYYTSKVQDAIVIDFTSTNYTIHDYNTSNPISNARPVLTYTKSGIWTKVTQENKSDRYAWYIFNSDGTTRTGWQKVGDYKYYFFTGNGAMQTGWKKESGYRYYLNNNLNSSFPEGAALTGWQTISGNKYYFAKSETSSFKLASAYTGVQTIDGKNYLFNANSGATEGALIKGWLKVGDAYFHSDDNGVVQTGWQKINGSWYFLDTGSSPKGKMATGFRKISNKWYYFKSNGVMIDNACETVGNNQYCAKSGGELKNFTGKVAKPTTSICKSITYNGTQQLITSNPPTGVSYSNNNVTNAGLHTVHAKVASNYAWSDSTAGTVDIPCYINPKSVSSATITVSGQTYTGSALTPLPTVKDGTKTLVKDTDYTVTYSNNVNVGTGTVTVTGKGNYTGTKQATFAINPIKVDKPTTSYCTNPTYNGSNQTITINPGTGYTFSGNTGTNVGTYTVTAKLNNNYQWKDGTSSNVTFNCSISPKSIAVATVTIPDQTYTGSALTPNPTIQDGTKILALNTDYTITYTNNINVGTATATITGKGNYTGTKIVTFKIKSSIKLVDKPTTNYCTNPTYNGSNQTITNSPGEGYTFSGNTGTNVGSYRITANLNTGYAWKDGTTSNVTFNCPINAKNISGSTISVSDQTYTGKQLTPLPTVKDESKTLVKDLDYAVTYSNNTNVGTATVTVTGKGNYTGTKQATFEINPIMVDKPTTSYCSNPTYNRNSQAITINPGKGYLFRGFKGTDAGTYTVSAELFDGYSWKDGTRDNVLINCSIHPKNVSDLNIIVDDQTYTGSELTPLPKVKDGTKILEKDTDYTVSYSNNINVGTATITITGQGNYEGTNNIDFDILSPVEPVVKVEKPTAEEYCKSTTYNGSSQTITNTPGTGYTFSDNIYTDAGTYQVIAKLKYKKIWSDDTEDDVSFTCSILPKDVTNVSVNEIDNQYYTGSELTPEPTIKDGTKILVKDTDYTLTYLNNVNVGIATVTITGQGNYTGTITKQFVISESAASFNIIDSSYMNLENNFINTKLKYGVKSINKSGFMSNIRTSNTWNLYDKKGNELSNDNSLVTTSSSIRYSDTVYNIIIYGDTDKDGLITIKDLYQSYLLYKNKANLDEHQIKASDYNKDGSVNIKDIYEIYKKMKEK